MTIGIEDALAQMLPGQDAFDDSEISTSRSMTDGGTGTPGYGTTGSGAGQAAVDRTAPIPQGGGLLEEDDPAKVFKAVDLEVERQSRLAKNRHEEGKHWERIKKGIPFAFLEKTEDQAVWEAKLAPGVDDRPQPIPNKVLDLCNKQVSQILVDPPLPNPKPDGDSERTRGAMDLAKRFLRADGDQSGTNDASLWREVLTLNRTWKAAFVYVWVDPTAGGWRPKQKMAHPQATDPANPLVGPTMDPKTGQPVLDAQGQPVLERTTDPVLRYVAEQDDPATGETREVFTDDAAAAAREWLPRHRRRVLHPSQVRTVPARATAFEAHSIILLMWEPLSEARKRFPQLADMSPTELKALTTWRPKRWKDIVPALMRPRGDGLDATGAVTDDTLLFWYHKFCRISPDYPDGAAIAVNGASLNGSRGTVLDRDTLREDVQLDDGTTVPVLMEPPVIQFSGILDLENGDPFGGAAVSLFGGANEIRAHLYLAALEDIDLRLHLNTFIGATSNVTRDDLNRRDNTPIDIVTKDDMPIFEQRPPLPASLPNMLERVEHDMDTSANLNQTAQALDSAYSESGRAKEVSISQAKVQLAQDWQGFIAGFIQYMKVKLQLAQARLTTPQLVKIGGENAAFKARYFVGADLIGVDSVSLAPGSGTMMSPSEKAQFLATAQGQSWLEKNEAGELFRSSMSDDLGLPPSPHEEHIDRCIAEWMEGPPKDWLDQYAANQTLPQRQQQYTATMQELVAAFVSAGTPAPQAQQMAQQHLGAPPQAMPLYTPFEPRANDEEPVVARTQYEKLSHLLSTSEFGKQPVPWRALVDQKYQAAATAAGIQTVRQQQAAQQAQAQAEAAAKAPKAAPTPTDPNAPPEWQEFLANATKAVVAKAQSLIVREVAAMGDATSVAHKPTPEPVPEELAATQAHAASESAADRAHEAAMQQADHANTMQQINAKNAGTIANTAAQAALTPTPDPSTPAE